MMHKTMQWMNTVCDWADSRGVDLKLIRDEVEWAALICFTDSNGPFSVAVDEPRRLPNSDKNFADAVYRQMDQAAFDARKARREKYAAGGRRMVIAA